jgi:membrane peptidoglycan carboxypeptidase
MNFQRLAEDLARQHVGQVDPAKNLTNAALVAMKPGSGEILAMLGSVDYKNEAIDGHVNVTLSPQQPGSSIKPLTYAAALSPAGGSGADPRWTAADILWDVPVEYEQFVGDAYVPVNYDGAFHGPVRLRDALANSYNIPAVLLLQDLIGVPRLLEFGRALGLDSWTGDSSQYGLSLTLGGGEVTPLELTTAYAALANGGNRVTPVSILRVERTNGEVLYEYTAAEPQRVIDERVAYLISDILDDDAAPLPGHGQPQPDGTAFPAAAKTGTTNDFRDNWTMGYTPGLVVGVWTGNTDNSPMVNISGLEGAAPLWSSYMQGSTATAAWWPVGDQRPGAADGVHPPAGTDRAAAVRPDQRDHRLHRLRARRRRIVPGERPAADPDADVDRPAVFWEKLDPAVWRAVAMPLPPPAPEACRPDPAGATGRPAAAAALLPLCRGDALELAAAGRPRRRCSCAAAQPGEPEAGPRVGAGQQHRHPAHVDLHRGLLALGAGRGADGRVAHHLAQADGDTVSGNVPIIGTASFDPAVVEFYKIELGIPNGPDIQWLTLGETHNTPVVNGQLEWLQAEGLPPGVYFLRLIVIQDSNYVGEPHQIQITVEAP